MLQPIILEKVENTVAALKKGKSAELILVQGGEETMVDVLREICNRRIAYPMDSVADYYYP